MGENRKCNRILSTVLLLFLSIIGGVLLHYGVINKSNSSDTQIQTMKNVGENKSNSRNNSNGKDQVTEDTNIVWSKENTYLNEMFQEENSKEEAEVTQANKEENLEDDSQDNLEGNLEDNNEENSVENIEKDIKEREPRKVKGIYVTGPKAGSKKYMNQLVNLVETTELNAMVIDIKNDLGEVTYNMDLDMVKEIKANTNYISNIEELIQELKSKDIYLIARIVAFKDPLLAERKNELSLKNKDGSIFKDKSSLSWVNPYNKEVWKYLVDIGEKAAQLGFDEIQYDYIRFSTDSGMKNVDFGSEAEGKSKVDVITEFTEYACDHLKPLGVFVSADVFGAIINSDTDANIVGQSYEKMSDSLDYICPMIYPSHYGNGSYGIKYPDLEPYEIIKGALMDSRAILEKNNTTKAIVRPWLQDFTAVWLEQYKKYGVEEIRAQIQGVYDAGYEEWILWNGSNNYTEKALRKE